jgi:acetyltransferase-like isoleucine patch superfamily enzyme
MNILRLLKIYFSWISGYLKRIRTKKIASSAFLAPGVQILGLEHIEIGENCTIGENTLFTINNRDQSGIKLSIGANTYIGRYNFFTVGKEIEIGAYCMFGNNCSFICSDHVFNSPLKPYLLTGATSDKRIKIGVNCWFGYNVSVVGNVTIGHGSIVGANSVVIKDIPPFSMAVGNPARIVKRFNFALGSWDKGENASESEYADERKYFDYLSKHFQDLPLSFHSSSKKFGDV